MRIRSPKRYDKRSFRIKKVNPRTMLVIACPKGGYSPSKGKCKVGTEVQSVIKKKRLTSDSCPLSEFKGFILHLKPYSKLSKVV
jgi:hypothetical protein